MHNQGKRIFVNNLPVSYPQRCLIDEALPWWRSAHLAKQLGPIRQRQAMFLSLTKGVMEGFPICRDRYV